MNQRLAQRGGGGPNFKTTLIIFNPLPVCRGFLDCTLRRITRPSRCQEVNHLGEIERGERQTSRHSQELSSITLRIYAVLSVQLINQL